jgi:hypothetical protein
MPVRQSRRAPCLKSLDQQKSDFTAEGSPPPGKVATDVPETSDAVAHAPKRPSPTQPR